MSTFGRCIDLLRKASGDPCVEVPPLELRRAELRSDALRCMHRGRKLTATSAAKAYGSGKKVDERLLGIAITNAYVCVCKCRYVH